MSRRDSFLRVLIEPKEKKELVWIATCLETGYVASGKTPIGARDEMFEILRHEYLYAVEHNNMRAFYSSTAIPQDLLDRWKDAIRGKRPKRIPLFPEGWQPVELATVSRAA